MIKPLSNKEKVKLLRRGKSSELKPGGVWYYKDEKSDFHTVINELDGLGMEVSEFRGFCNKCSKFGYLYINREYPNFSLTEEMHIFDFNRMEKYNGKCMNSK